MTTDLVKSPETQISHKICNKVDFFHNGHKRLWLFTKKSKSSSSQSLSAVSLLTPTLTSEEWIILANLSSSTELHLSIGVLLRRVQRRQYCNTMQHYSSIQNSNTPNSTHIDRGRGFRTWVISQAKKNANSDEKTIQVQDWRYLH